MLEYLVLGVGFAFAAAVQPGPLQAFLLSKVVERGWKRTLPACLSPLISDGPIALLVLLVLRRLPEQMGRILQIAGGIVLLYLAWATYRQGMRRNTAEADASASAPGTLAQAVAVNILNPGPYLGWSLIMGPAVLTAWKDGPANAVALVVAFYGTMVTSLAAIVWLFGTTRFLGPAGRRALVVVSALMLAALGVYRLAVVEW